MQSWETSVSYIDQYPDLACTLVSAFCAIQITAPLFARKLVMTCFKDNVLAMPFGGAGVDDGSWFMVAEVDIVTF